MERVTTPLRRATPVEVCRIADIWDGEMGSFCVRDTSILIVKLAGQFHAYEGRCPHQGAALVEGELAGTVLICHAHHWQFNAATGAGINPRNVCLKRLNLEIVDGRVCIDV
jgi:toluene monooxygenase system ferredoxin subunit